MSEIKGAGPEKPTLIFKHEPGFSWRGMNPDKKPFMLKPNVPQQMVNMRLRAGEVEGRGGQALIANHSSPITGMVDFFTEVVGGRGPCPSITITPATLPAVYETFFYSEQLSVTGGVAPYTWSVSSGSLPDGLSLDADGLISGYPTTVGEYAFTVTCRDANGCPGDIGGGGIWSSGDITYSLVVDALPAPECSNGWGLYLESGIYPAGSLVMTVTGTAAFGGVVDTLGFVHPDNPTFALRYSTEDYDFLAAQPGKLYRFSGGVAYRMEDSGGTDYIYTMMPGASSATFVAVAGGTQVNGMLDLGGGTLLWTNNSEIRRSSGGSSVVETTTAGDFNMGLGNLGSDVVMAEFTGARIRNGATSTWGAFIAYGGAGNLINVLENSYDSLSWLYGTRAMATLTSGGVLTEVLPVDMAADMGANGAILGMAELDGALYAAWRTSTGLGSNIWIARYFGGTWDSYYKDITAQTTYQAYLGQYPASEMTGAYELPPVGTAAFGAYNGSLVLFLRFPGFSCNIEALCFSPSGGDVADSWTRMVMPYRSGHFGGIATSLVAV